jgi:uncharacterized protein YggU (UPF0235/DUF167 family)
MATLRFHVVPNAKVDSVLGEHGAAIKIKLRAPASEGKANAALRSFLSKEMKSPNARSCWNMATNHARKSFASTD